MKLSFFTKIVLLTLLFAAISSSSAQTLRPIGTNLSGIQDWSTEYVFVDVFNQSRKWISHEYGSGVPWSSNLNIPLGPNGYPLEIPYNDGVNPPQAIRTLMYFGELNGRYPSGNYRLMASGSGQIRLWGAASGTFTCPVDTVVSVNSSMGGIALEIDTSLVGDPVRDIHVVMPGFENTFATEPFHPDFLSFIEDFQVLRFMDWMKTNGSPIQSWADRNSTDYYAQTLDNGAAYGHILDLCNRTQKDPWICIPHRADDNYITEMARLLRDSLDPALKIYVEYSNEVWNSQFGQSQYADSMGNALGYMGNPWDQGWQYYAKRTADIMHIFDTEFQGSNRLVKVISSQAANSWVTKYILERFNEPLYNPNQVQVDAIAIAPYFGGVANRIGDAGLINTTTVNDILDSMEISLQRSFNWMDETKVVADTHNLELIAYEGGQHLVASPVYYNDTAFVTKLKNANRHPRMEDLYCQYFNYWYDSTQAGIFANFSSHSLYSKFGSWGVKEFMDDTLSPKYLGLQNCVFSYNTDTTTVGIFDSEKTEPGFLVYPNPTLSGQLAIEHEFDIQEMHLIDMMGRQVHFVAEELNENTFSLVVPGYKGFAILVLRNGDGVVSRKVLFE